MTENAKPQAKFSAVARLQGIIAIYTLSGVFGKMATQGNAVMSPSFLLYITLDLVTLGVYALLWQQALKRFDLHVAYANRSMATVWGIIWAVLVFHETVTVMNVAGTVCILAGTMLVNSNDAK